MNEIKHYNETLFESIKHINEYGRNSGTQGNLEKY